MTRRLFSLIGGTSGSWQVTRMETVSGAPLAPVERIEVIEDAVVAVPSDASWVLRGATSYERYVTRTEQDALKAIQPATGRPEATRVALIPMKKSAAWWALPQDERRAIFEEQSHHIRIGMDYLPAVARRLLHGTDLGEPFDFLAWLEYAPEHADAFEEMTRQLRQTEEWRYVEREIDIRLTRVDG